MPSSLRIAALSLLLVTLPRSDAFVPWSLRPSNVAFTAPTVNKWSQQEQLEQATQLHLRQQTTERLYATVLFAKKKKNNAKAAALEALETLDALDDEPMSAKEAKQAAKKKAKAAKKAPVSIDVSAFDDDDDDAPKLSKKELKAQMKAKQQGGGGGNQKASDAKAAALAALDNLDFDDEDDGPKLSKKELKKMQKAKQQGQPPSPQEEPVVAAATEQQPPPPPPQKAASAKDAAMQKLLEMEAADAARQAAMPQDDQPKLSKKELKALKKKQEKEAAKLAKKEAKKKKRQEALEAEGGDAGAAVVGEVRFVVVVVVMITRIIFGRVDCYLLPSPSAPLALCSLTHFITTVSPFHKYSSLLSVGCSRRSNCWRRRRGSCGTSSTKACQVDIGGKDPEGTSTSKDPCHGECPTRLHRSSIGGCWCHVPGPGGPQGCHLGCSNGRPHRSGRSERCWQDDTTQNISR